MSEAVCAELLDRVGWLIPYHLQVVVSEILEQMPRGDDTRMPESPLVEVTSAHVESALEAILSPAKRNHYFDYWRQRLDEELGKPDSRWARRLLTAVASDPRGVSIDTLSQVLAADISDPEERVERLRFLIDVLVRDGYLVEEAGRFRFRSPLVRAFWVERIAG